MIPTLLCHIEILTSHMCVTKHVRDVLTWNAIIDLDFRSPSFPGISCIGDCLLLSTRSDQYFLAILFM